MTSSFFESVMQDPSYWESVGDLMVAKGLKDEEELITEEIEEEEEDLLQSIDDLWFDRFLFEEELLDEAWERWEEKRSRNRKYIASKRPKNKIRDKRRIFYRIVPEWALETAGSFRIEKTSRSIYHLFGFLRPYSHSIRNKGMMVFGEGRIYRNLEYCEANGFRQVEEVAFSSFSRRGGFFYVSEENRNEARIIGNFFVDVSGRELFIDMDHNVYFPEGWVFTEKMVIEKRERGDLPLRKFRRRGSEVPPLGCERVDVNREVFYGKKVVQEDYCMGMRMYESYKNRWSISETKKNRKATKAFIKKMDPLGDLMAERDQDLLDRYLSDYSEGALETLYEFERLDLPYKAVTPFQGVWNFDLIPGEDVMVLIEDYLLNKEDHYCDMEYFDE